MTYPRASMYGSADGTGFPYIENGSLVQSRIDAAARTCYATRVRQGIPLDPAFATSLPNTVTSATSAAVLDRAVLFEGSRMGAKHGHSIDRFWRHVQKSDGCWLWTAGTVRYGYGSLNFYERTTLAHRASWEIHFGAIPDGLYVLHHCDVPACVRPDHLYLGTQADNIRDMIERGRHGSKTHPEWSSRGSDRYNALLDENKVKEIRRLNGSVSDCELARRFGVTYSTIRLVRIGKNWKHVR